jgi:Tfp pilus assembly protein PilV
MDSKYLKQDGLTLIELLVSISLLFLVGMLVFNVLIKGKEYSLQAQSTIYIQQEGNRISTKLTSWHEKNKQYKIVLNQNPDATSISLIPYDGAGNLLEDNQEVISSNSFYYSVCYDRNQDDSNICTDRSLNKLVTQKALPIKILIKDKKNSRLTFEIKTIISRM